MTDLTPRVYIASLSDYNNGILHGEWIDADQDPECLQDDINDILESSPTAKRYGQPAEEWAVHDSEGMPDMGEWPSLDDISRVANAVAEHGEPMLAWLNYRGEHSEEIIRAFESAYRGEFNSDEDFAEQFADDIGLLDQIPENLRFYFDMEAYARDLMQDFFEVDGFYFDSNW